VFLLPVFFFFFLVSLFRDGEIEEKERRTGDRNAAIVCSKVYAAII